MSLTYSLESTDTAIRAGSDLALSLAQKLQILSKEIDQIYFTLGDLSKSLSKQISDLKDSLQSSEHSNALTYQCMVEGMANLKAEIDAVQHSAIKPRRRSPLTSALSGDILLEVLNNQSSLKYAVQAASTGNLTLSGLQSVDGVSLAENDLCLVKDQTTKSENGIYNVLSGAWTRHDCLDNSSEILPTLGVKVLGGTAHGSESYILQNESGILDTDDLIFAEMNAVTQNLMAADLNATSSLERKVQVRLVDSKGNLHAWADFEPTVTPAETVTDADVGVPVVEYTPNPAANPRFKNGIMELTIKPDVDSGATKTYAASDSIDFTVDVTANALCSAVGNLQLTFSVL